MDSITKAESALEFVFILSVLVLIFDVLILSDKLPGVGEAFSINKYGIPMQKNSNEQFSPSSGKGIIAWISVASLSFVGLSILDKIEKKKLNKILPK